MIPLLVCRFQCIADLLRDDERFFDRYWPACNSIRQCFAFDEFENDVAYAIGFFEIVNGSDVRVIQRCKNFSLTLKPADTIHVTRELLRQDLYRDFALQLRVTCAIHLTHAALAEEGRYLVRTKVSANDQSHDFAGRL